MSQADGYVYTVETRYTPDGLPRITRYTGEVRGKIAVVKERGTTRRIPNSTCCHFFADEADAREFVRETVIRHSDKAEREAARWRKLLADPKAVEFRECT